MTGCSYLLWGRGEFIVNASGGLGIRSSILLRYTSALSDVFSEQGFSQSIFDKVNRIERSRNCY